MISTDVLEGRRNNMIKTEVIEKLMGVEIDGWNFCDEHFHEIEKAIDEILTRDVIYISESGKGYTEEEIRKEAREFILKTPELADMVYQHRALTDRVYRAIMTLITWEHPNTITDQFNEEDIETFEMDISYCSSCNDFFDRADMNWINDKYGIPFKKVCPACYEKPENQPADYELGVDEPDDY